ncbi:hypothetical protein JVW24_25865, partial [Vibrio cholerae O1]|nr:hypothetical protein [Vibrio cholerae O1]
MPRNSALGFAPSGLAQALFCNSTYCGHRSANQSGQPEAARHCLLLSDTALRILHRFVNGL